MGREIRHGGIDIVTAIRQSVLSAITFVMKPAPQILHFGVIRSVEQLHDRSRWQGKNQEVLTYLITCSIFQLFRSDSPGKFHLTPGPFCIGLLFCRHFRPHLLQAMHKMPAIATDVTRSVVCVSVCELVTRICCAKTAEPIEMPFVGADSIGPRNYISDVVKIGRIHSQPQGVTRQRCALCQITLNTCSAQRGY